MTSNEPGNHVELTNFFSDVSSDGARLVESAIRSNQHWYPVHRHLCSIESMLRESSHSQSHW